MKIYWSRTWNWNWTPQSAPLLVICDAIFKHHRIIKEAPPNLHFYFVKAGENLKDIDQFPRHLAKIQKTLDGITAKGVIALGGGSIGDFSGFFASVYKRGVDFYQCPTTWLAAIDSAHGGKTALNCGNYKNQIGSFKQAHTVFICREILEQQPAKLLKDGLNELYKISLISGGNLWVQTVQLAQYCGSTSETKLANSVWKTLKSAVAAKYAIVKKDPFEKRGVRQILNLGHTMGHVFELHCQLSHGAAVNYGLYFALQFSRQKMLITNRHYQQIMNSPIGKQLHEATEKRIWKFLTKRKIVNTLIQDKKKNSEDNSINFIFVKNIGRVVCLPITLKEILAETERQRRLSCE